MTRPGTKVYVDPVRHILRPLQTLIGQLAASGELIAIEEATRLWRGVAEQNQVKMDLAAYALAHHVSEPHRPAAKAIFETVKLYDVR